MTQEWELRANAKRESVLDKIPEEWRLKDIPDSVSLPNVINYATDYLSEEERRITAMDFGHLASAIASGQITSRKATESFAHRAAIAHQLVSENIHLDKLFMWIHARICINRGWSPR